MSLECDMIALNDRIAGLYDAFIGAGQYGDASTIMRDEGAKLVVTIGKLTPPLGTGGKNAGAKQAGEKAIEREIKSLFSEAGPDVIDEVGSKHGLKGIDSFIESKDKQPIRIQWDNLDPTGNRMDEYHRRYQNNRGKVKLQKQAKGIWKARVVVPYGTRDAFIKKLKARVGRWRASITKALPALGKSVPGWIRRHFGSVDGITILDLSQINNPIKPGLLFGSRAPGCGDAGFQSRCRTAVNIGAKAIEKRIRLVVIGYSKDVAHGMRPRKHAAESSGPQESLE